MYVDAQEVIETLCRVGVLSSDIDADEWLRRLVIPVPGEAQGPWESFGNEFCLSDFGSFDELRRSYEVHEEGFKESAWENADVELAAENALERAFDDWAGGLDSEQKLEILRDNY
jgi:hypothetical protein